MSDNRGVVWGSCRVGRRGCYLQQVSPGIPDHQVQLMQRERHVLPLPDPPSGPPRSDASRPPAAAIRRMRSLRGGVHTLRQPPPRCQA